MDKKTINEYDFKGYLIKIHKPILTNDEREIENVKLVEKLKASIDTFEVFNIDGV